MLLEAESRGELTDIRQQFGTRCDWVWQNLLTKAQRSKLKAIASVEQLNLLAPSLATQEEEWFAEANLTQMAEDLTQCESAEQLDLLRRCWPPQAMNLACKQLLPEKHSQIKQWVIELNRSVSTDSLCHHDL